MLYFVVKIAEIMEKLLKLMFIDLGNNTIDKVNMYPGDGLYLAKTSVPNQNVCYFIVLIKNRVYDQSLLLPEEAIFEDVSATKKESKNVAHEQEWIGSKTLLELVRIIKK